MIADIYLLIIFIFLLNGISAGLVGYCVGRKYVIQQTIFFTFFSIVLCVVLWWLSFTNYGVINSGVVINRWFHIGNTTITLGFIFTNLTFSMTAVVTIVSTFVHWYAIEYMKYDPHLIRFLAYLSLFTFCMLLLINSDNLVQFFLSWEGVGVCSYLLINFWYTRLEANKSALKAIILNRVGDFFLLTGLSLIFFLTRSFDFHVLQNYDLIQFVWEQEFSKSLTSYFYINKLHLAALCFFIGAMGKSAQIGLHTWLPDAMEGPTPVSALIHAATMVTAGVFLIIKCSFLFEFSIDVSNLIAFIGLTTAIFAGSVACFQFDIKKVIAYSTCSQLGYMIFSCGLHHYTIAFFHLLTHAFFKALLFLTAGALIHYFGGEQDLRKMGAVDNSIPFLSCAMFIGSLALVGFPFLAGYYSKDAILESVFTNYNKLSHFVYFTALLGALITAYYSLRLYYLICFAETKVPFNRLHFLHNVNILMGGALMFLVIFSIFSGYLMKDIFTGVGSLFFVNDIKLSIPLLSYTDLHFIVPTLIRFLPSIVLLFSICLILIIFYFIVSKNQYRLKFQKTRFVLKEKLSFIFYFLFRTLFFFFNKRWFFDSLYNYFFSRSFLNFGYKISYVLLDKGFIENFGPQFLINCLYFFLEPIRLFNSGRIRDNLRVSLIGFLGVIFFLVYSLFFFMC
jgi:proton-translocating NADH-quinone oxidoreductase chain L